MANSDSSTNFSQVHGTCTVSDGGSNSLILDFVRSDFAWTEEGKPYTEAKVRNQHQSTPDLVEIGDGNVTGSMRIGVTSFRGATAVKPYEAVTGTGLAAGWTTTAQGTKKAKRFTLAFVNPAGASQTVVFNYCVCMNVNVDPAGDDGLMVLSFDFTDHENAPTVT